MGYDLPLDQAGLCPHFHYFCDLWVQHNQRNKLVCIPIFVDCTGYGTRHGRQTGRDVSHFRRACDLWDTIQPRFGWRCAPILLIARIMGHDIQRFQLRPYPYSWTLFDLWDTSCDTVRLTVYPIFSDCMDYGTWLQRRESLFCLPILLIFTVYGVRFAA